MSQSTVKRHRQSERDSTEPSDTQPAPYSQADYAKMICEIADKLGYAHDYASVMKVLADPNDPRNQPLYPVGARVTVIQAVALDLHVYVGDLGQLVLNRQFLRRPTFRYLLPSPNKMPDNMEGEVKIVQEFLSDSMKSAQTTA